MEIVINYKKLPGRSTYSKYWFTCPLCSFYSMPNLTSSWVQGLALDHMYGTHAAAMGSLIITYTEETEPSIAMQFDGRGFAEGVKEASRQIPDSILPALKRPWEVKGTDVAYAYDIYSELGDDIVCDIPFGAYADHIVKLHNDSLVKDVVLEHYYTLSSSDPICEVGMQGSSWVRRQAADDAKLCARCRAIVEGRVNF